MRAPIALGLANCVLVSWAGAAPRLKDPPKKEPTSVVGVWTSESEGDQGVLHIFTADGEYIRDDGQGGRRHHRYTIDTNKSPAELDITSDHLRVVGIFRGDASTIEYCHLHGGPRPTKFEAADRPKVWLSVYKRVKD